MRPLLTRLAVAAEPSAWREAGFQVDGQNATAGAVTISLGGAGSGKRITGWELAGLGSTELDGLPTGRASDAPAAAPAAAHPNGVTRLDHVVAFSPDLDRTVSALEAAGLDLRRVREGPTAAGARRQAFFRVGDPLLEVIEHPPGTEAAQRPRRARPFLGPGVRRAGPRGERGAARAAPRRAREMRSSRAAGSRPCAARRRWASPWP